MAQTHDIEDVLSSIRRLVASEGPGAGRPSSDGPALVLGEAQRVTEPEDPFQTIRSLAQEERDANDAMHFADGLPWDTTMPLRAFVAPTEGAANEPDFAQNDPAPDAISDDVPVAPEELRAETAEPDETPDMWNDGHHDSADTPRDYAEDADFEVPDEHHVVDQSVETGLDATSGRTEMAEADGASILSDLSRTPVDDEALRDLIAEVVRQELSGELGERITRNVRKLVRREIRQMLASEEFD